MKTPPIPEVNESSFNQQVLQSELPALVVVRVNGSGTDRAFQKLLEEWIPQAREQLRILELKIDRSPELAERFGIPLAAGLALFSDGVLRYQFMGEASRRDLDELLMRASRLGSDPAQPA